MKAYNYIRSINLFWCFLFVCMFGSCVNSDSIPTCGPDVKLRFQYTYNVKESDAFAYEVGRVRVWVFDSDDKFVTEYIDDNDHFSDDYFLHIGYLPPGTYTFVAWCRSRSCGEAGSSYNYTKMIPGVSTLCELTARLSRADGNRYQTRLNSSLNGTASVNITDEGEQTITLDMIKCTNTLKVIIMPYRAGQQLDSDNFRFAVNGRNAWLNYDASLYQEDPVVYRPYYKATLHDAQAAGVVGTRADGEPVDNAIVAEMNLSRLFYELGPRFTIQEIKSNTVLMDINLTWLLSLQSIGDHRSAWNDQEYLDRQDKFTIMFFVDGDVLMQNHIVVNGWNISLEDNELQ